jgi:hypothetical protein
VLGVGKSIAEYGVLGIGGLTRYLSQKIKSLILPVTSETKALL